MNELPLVQHAIKQVPFHISQSARTHVNSESACRPRWNLLSAEHFEPGRPLTFLERETGLTRQASRPSGSPVMSVQVKDPHARVAPVPHRDTSLLPRHLPRPLQVEKR